MPMGEGMTQQHITQEQATQIAAQFAEDATYEFNIANAAIQHYLDQRNVELPLLPDTYGSAEEQIVERYRVGKTQGGFWPSCVKAGDGNMDVFVGSTKQAENVRQALQTACLDGAFIASQKAKEQYKDYGQQCAAHARKLALSDAIKQVTILYEKDDYPVLTDICNLIATAK